MFPAPSREPSEDYHYEGWFQLRTPLQHGGDESLGNVRLFRAQKTVCTDGKVRRIPIYSGNAIRGMLRDIAAAQLLETLNVALPPHVFDFLTSGGTLTGGGQQVVDVDLARRLRNTIPSVGLFGGGTGNQIIEGKLIILQGTPICRETLHLLPDYCREAPSAALSIRDLRQLEFGTRRDDKKKESNQHLLAGLIKEKGSDDVSTSMIYETETLAPGSCLRFGFRARSLTRREWVTLGMALVGFIRSPFLGGRSAAGYGEIVAPTLYRSNRVVNLLQDTAGIVDLEKSLAEVREEVDKEDRLALVAEQLEAAYTEDVRGRRAEILAALEKVV